MNVVFSYGNGRNKEADRQNVNIRVYHGKSILGLDFRRSTGLEVSLKDWEEWNSEKKEFKLKGARTPDERRYILNVQEHLQSIDRAFKREFQELTLSHQLKSQNKLTWNEWCEATLEKGLGIKREVSEEVPFLLDKYREYIDLKSRTWSSNTIRNNESALKMLSAFMDFNKFIELYKPKDKERTEWEQWYLQNHGKSKARQYRTNETDIHFYNILQDWNLKKGNGLSGAFSDQIKHIKAMLRYFESTEGIAIHHNLNHKDFKPHTKNPDHDILTEEELKLIFNYTGKGYLENVRDLAKIQYYACIRYDELRSELNKGIEKMDIVKSGKNGYRWNIYQQKVKSTKSIPLHGRILSMINEDSFPHLIKDQKYREFIKELLAILQIDKHKKIGTHTFRRSFCTNMFNNGHSFAEIMQYSGQQTESQVREYIQAKNVVINNTIPTE
jgi:integrase